MSSNDELCEDVLLECTSSNVSSSAKYARNQNNNKLSTLLNDSDDDDIEIQNAKEKLRQLQKKEEKQRKEEKLRMLAEETRRLEKSLKSSKEKNVRSKSKHDTTTADLRSMSDVVQKVDRLMDDKKLNFKSDSSDCESDSGACAVDRARRKTDSDEEIPDRKKVGGGDEKKKKSGKESKLTSDVDFPQIWPHSKLRGHFVGKDKKYDDLTIAEFVAGYMSIVMKSKSIEKKARIAHLEELMYLATHKTWKSVLNYHGACLLEIERGNLEWGDNFQLHGLQSTFFNVVGQGQNFQQRGSTSSAFDKPATSSNFMGGNEKVWFCKAYQSGNCTFPRDHNGYMFGRTEFLRHICAKCWQAGRKQSPHSEQSDACPLFKVEL